MIYQCKTFLFCIAVFVSTVGYGQPGEIIGCSIFLPRKIYNTTTSSIENILPGSITCKSRKHTAMLFDSDYSGYYMINYIGWPDTIAYDTITISFSNTKTTIDLYGTYLNRYNYFLTFQTITSGEFVINLDSDLIEIKSKYWNSDENWEKYRKINALSPQRLQRHTTVNNTELPGRSYFHKVSPLVGVSQWTSTSIDIGIATEIYYGKDIWQPKPTAFCHLLGQSLSAEIFLGKKIHVNPKYSLWFHSSKLSVFSIGSSLLYTPENGVFIRPELGIVLPKQKMEPLFGIQFLRIKFAYGYNVKFSNNPLPFGNNNISLIMYFGNNIGGYRSMR